MEDFGAGVVSVWEGLRSTTRILIVNALQSSSANANAATRSGAVYDARSDWELSRLLAALDARAADDESSLSTEQAGRLKHMAETTAAVLQERAQSAEVFAQLVERAVRRRDYARVDRLADALSARFAPGEICELARQPSAVSRALAHEALAQAPTAALVALLADPVDAVIAREALERQAIEFDSEDARQFLNMLEQMEAEEDF
ncbi:MAG: hypothetical protein AUG51_17430 [Acidobacteria bacterium 13_1_20CM_3_53_8]|nr:MAG: hypothetical protein AUG51_17430 [Acidobacteria bacterium 13_1_20CM_3_53_8]